MLGPRFREDERKTSLRDAFRGFRQQLRQPLGPLPLAGLLVDQVLADFDRDMRDAALLAVHRDRIVGLVVDV